MASFPLSANVITEEWIEFGNHLGKRFFAPPAPHAVSGSSEISTPYPEA